MEHGLPAVDVMHRQLSVVVRVVGAGIGNVSLFFFNDTATTEIYTLSLHDALPIFDDDVLRGGAVGRAHGERVGDVLARGQRIGLGLVQRVGIRTARGGDPVTAVTRVPPSRC